MATLNGIILSDLRWVDDLEWTGIHCEVEDGINGNLVAQQVALTDGRPITLEGDDKSGWLSRSVLDSLRTLAAVVDATYTLIINSVSYTVRFRHEDAPVIEAEPVIDYEVPGSTDMYNNIAIKLITV